jgi:hypothetical protein
VRAIHLRQQGDVGGCVLGGEPLPSIDRRLHFPGLGIGSNQPRDLRQAQAGDFAQVRPDGASLLPSLLMVLLVDQHLFDPVVHLCAALPAELDPRAALQKLVDLRMGQALGIPHSELHSPATYLPCSSHFQDHLALESSPVSGSSCIG